MNPGQPVRLGVIGCGRVACERHLPAWRRLPGLRVVAASDLDSARLDRFAGLLGVADRFTEYRALLDHSGIDAVAILTPTQSHVEIAVAALEAGKHVFLEKPLALNLAEAGRLIECSARSSAKVVVGFNLRWHRLVRRARALLDTGVLGRIKAIRSVYTHDRSGAGAPDWHRFRALGGGVAFNEGVHHYDLWRHLTGCDVECVFSTSAPSAVYEDETSAILANLSGGASATGVFSFKSGPNSEVEIFGEAGRLLLSLYRFDGLEFLPDSLYPGNISHRVKQALRALGDLPEAVPILRRGGDFAETFHALWQHFIDCVQNDRPTACSIEDGRRALQVALAGIESASTGLPVRISPQGPR